MKRNYIIYLLIISLAVSCGKSQEEKELEKIRQELELTKSQLATKNQEENNRVLAFENKKKEEIHRQKLNVGKKKKTTELSTLIDKANELLSSKRSNLLEIQEFQFGRSSATKEQQLKLVMADINQLEKYIRNAKNEIAELELYKTFEFQKSPRSVLEYIFQSAKNNDFSNFQYLCDPYGENDSDLKSICYADLMPENGKKELKENFSNGRIMVETEISNDSAKIEFAFGSSSNKLETMNFIKRNDNWYLLGL